MTDGVESGLGGRPCKPRATHVINRYPGAKVGSNTRINMGRIMGM